MSKHNTSSKQRIYRAALEGTDGKALKDESGANVVLYFPYPVTVKGAEVFKADGSKAGKDALKMEKTPLKDNVASYNGEPVYYNADSMSKDERKALAKANKLTVASTRMSEPIAALDALIKWMQANARSIPLEMRTEGWNKIAAMTQVLETVILPPAAPEAAPGEAKPKVGKPNYFTSYFA